MGIVYQAFPPDGGTWLFKVDSHDDNKIIFSLLSVSFEELRIFKTGIDVVN